MQRWNWFLAADFQGKWIMTNGYAEISFNEYGFTASLRFAADGDVYHLINASISNGDIHAHISSPDPDAPEYDLTGSLYVGKNADTAEMKTIVLTDGSTVLGLTHGPHSGEDNL